MTAAFADMLGTGYAKSPRASPVGWNGPASPLAGLHDDKDTTWPSLHQQRTLPPIGTARTDAKAMSASSSETNSNRASVILHDSSDCFSRSNSVDTPSIIASSSDARSTSPVIAISPVDANHSAEPLNSSPKSINSNASFEAQFDSMLRQSPLFLNLVHRVSQLEHAVSNLAISSQHMIPPLSPAASITSAALSSPAQSMPTFATDRDTIRQLSTQVSGLAANVAQIMATNARAQFDTTPSYHPSARGQPLSRTASYDRAGYFNLDERRRSSLLPLPPLSQSTSRRHSATELDASIGLGNAPLTPGMEGMHRQPSTTGWDGSQSTNGGGMSLATKWENLGMNGDALRALVKYGSIGPPSKIQIKAVPCILRNQDIVAQASAIQERIQSYIVPAIQIVATALNSQSLGLNSPAAPPKGLQVLICTATLDQAGQAQRLASGLGAPLGILSSVIAGAGDIAREANELQAAPPHILVGTPQKLLDLFTMRTIPLQDLSLLVIDECDQLLARNLSDLVANLVRLLPTSCNPRTINAPPTQFSPFDNQPSPKSATSGERQTCIFSCTVPSEVLTFASSLGLREPVRVLVRRDGPDNQTTNASLRGIRHFYCYIAVGSNGSASSRAPGAGRQEATSAREWKLEALVDMCEDADFQSCVVYCSSMESVEAVAYKLCSRGIDALSLHAEMGNTARQAVLQRFRSAPTPGRSLKRILVVFDGLCRTLSDIHQVAIVINYDLPRASDDYIHRIACAAAAGYGRQGTAVTMVASNADVEVLRNIEINLRIKINELPPSIQSIC